MNLERRPNGDRVYIHSGEVVFSEKPVCLKTILGSCIAVCFYNKEHALGGMIHGMYPGYGDSTAYIGNAIEAMLKEFQRRGISTARLEVTIIGGATQFGIMSLNTEQKSVGQLNQESVLDVVRTYNLKIRAMDLGCACSRTVIFNVEDGTISVEKLMSEKSCSSLFCKNRTYCPAVKNPATL